MSVIKLDFTPEEKAERLTGIGGSHAPKIMAGQWLDVWLELTGRAPSRKIMSDWRYALRMATETLQMDWFEYKTGKTVSHRQVSIRSAEYPWMRCTLDGLIEPDGSPINAKHISKWTPGVRLDAAAAREWAINAYAWQIVHEAVVANPESMTGYISLIVGDSDNEPDVFPIEVNPVSMGQLIEAERKFWGFVERDEPPDPNYQPIVPIIEWEKLREVDMTSSNSWAENAAIWRETISMKRRCDKAAKELRALVEPDVREATGHGVLIKRSRDGRSLYIEEVNDA